MTDKPGIPPRPSEPANAASSREAKLDALIGGKLRSYFDELMAEPVPTRILDLLSELEDKEHAEKAEKNR